MIKRSLVIMMFAPALTLAVLIDGIFGVTNKLLNVLKVTKNTFSWRNTVEDYKETYKEIMLYIRTGQLH